MKERLPFVAVSRVQGDSDVAWPFADLEAIARPRQARSRECVQGSLIDMDLHLLLCNSFTANQALVCLLVKFVRLRIGANARHVSFDYRRFIAPPAFASY